MEKRKLGNTDIYLTELGYGCASLWGKTVISDEDAENLFMEAYEHGIRFFDTGYSYGMAERRLGKCLRHLGFNARKDIVISTKCGTRRSKRGKYYHDWSTGWLWQSVKISLKRLGTDYIDLLQVHGPAVEEITVEMLEFLQKLKKKGIVKATGINTFDTDVIEWVAQNRAFDFVMLDYNILRQDREDVIDLLCGNGIGVIAGAPLAQSLYSNRVYKVKGIKDLWYLLRALKNFRGHMVEGRNYQFMNEMECCSGSQLALRYVLDNPNVASAVFGSVTPGHIAENIGAADISMPDEIRRKIKAHRKATAKKLDRKQ